MDLSLSGSDFSILTPRMLKIRSYIKLLKGVLLFQWMISVVLLTVMSLDISKDYVVQHRASIISRSTPEPLMRRSTEIACVVVLFWSLMISVQIFILTTLDVLEDNGVQHRASDAPEQQKKRAIRELADAVAKYARLVVPHQEQTEHSISSISLTWMPAQSNVKNEITDIQIETVNSMLCQRTSTMNGGPQRHRYKEAGKMYATFIHSLDASSSAVAKITWSNGSGGTGWLVGTGQRKFLVTNYHTIDEMPPVSQAHEQERQKHRWAYFNFDRPLQPGDTPLCVRIRDPFLVDSEIDVAVLELELTNVEPHTKQHLPEPITRFRKLKDGNETLHFIGHPGGNSKVLDIQCKTLPAENILRMHRHLLEWSFATFKANKYPKVTDERRVMYNTSEDFGPGTSGCPGFIMDQDYQASLAVIHAFAFPDDPNPPPGMPEEYHFEQGIRIEHVYDLIRSRDEDICSEIFTQGRPYPIDIY